MTSPRVSVVVPTYNRPDKLRRAVGTVVEQTYAPVELVVVDDHSETPASDADTLGGGRRGWQPSPHRRRTEVGGPVIRSVVTVYR